MLSFGLFCDKTMNYNIIDYFVFGSFAGFAYADVPLLDPELVPVLLLAVLPLEAGLLLAAEELLDAPLPELLLVPDAVLPEVLLEPEAVLPDVPEVPLLPSATASRFCNGFGLPGL